MALPLNRVAENKGVGRVECHWKGEVWLTRRFVLVLGLYWIATISCESILYIAHLSYLTILDYLGWDPTLSINTQLYLLTIILMLFLIRVKYLLLPDTVGWLTHHPISDTMVLSKKFPNCRREQCRKMTKIKIKTKSSHKRMHAQSMWFAAQ